MANQLLVFILNPLKGLWQSTYLLKFISAPIFRALWCPLHPKFDIYAIWVYFLEMLEYIFNPTCHWFIHLCFCEGQVFEQSFNCEWHFHEFVNVRSSFWSCLLHVKGTWTVQI
jgi:hypothetical protein